MHLLDLDTLFLGFLDFLLLQLLLGNAARHDGLDVGLVFLEADTVTGLEAGPLPVGLGTGVVLVEEVVVPAGLEVPRTGLHAPPLFLLL